MAELARKPGHGFEQQDPGAFAQARLEAHAAAADAGELASRIDGGVVHRRGAAVRPASPRALDRARWSVAARSALAARRPGHLRISRSPSSNRSRHGVALPVVHVRLGALHRGAAVQAVIASGASTARPLRASAGPKAWKRARP